MRHFFTDEENEALRFARFCGVRGLDPNSGPGRRDGSQGFLKGLPIDPGVLRHLASKRPGAVEGYPAFMVGVAQPSDKRHSMVLADALGKNHRVILKGLVEAIGERAFDGRRLTHPVQAVVLDDPSRITVTRSAAIRAYVHVVVDVGATLDAEGAQRLYVRVLNGTPDEVVAAIGGRGGEVKGLPAEPERRKVLEKWARTRQVATWSGSRRPEVPWLLAELSPDAPMPQQAREDQDRELGAILAMFPVARVQSGFGDFRLMRIKFGLAIDSRKAARAIELGAGLRGVPRPAQAIVSLADSIVRPPDRPEDIDPYGYIYGSSLARARRGSGWLDVAFAGDDGNVDVFIDVTMAHNTFALLGAKRPAFLQLVRDLYWATHLGVDENAGSLREQVATRDRRETPPPSPALGG